MTDAEAVTERVRRDEFSGLTPLQQLVLENLGSRLRLGHEVWTFTSSKALTKALRSLADLGYLGWKTGVVQGTNLVWLTDAGKWLILDPHYVPPIAKVRERGDECPYCDDLKDHPNGPCTHWYEHSLVEETNHTDGT